MERLKVEMLAVWMVEMLVVKKAARKDACSVETWVVQKVAMLVVYLVELWVDKTAEMLAATMAVPRAVVMVGR